jgi:hypothetical protein
VRVISARSASTAPLAGLDIVLEKGCPLLTSAKEAAGFMLDIDQRPKELAVVATVPADRPTLEESPRAVATINMPQGRDDPVAKRRRKAEALVARGGGREPLEELRSRYLHRLHRASDDFEATEELRMVEVALAQVPRPLGVWAWQHRELRPRGRFWRRRKKM